MDLPCVPQATKVQSGDDRRGVMQRQGERVLQNHHKKCRPHAS